MHSSTIGKSELILNEQGRIYHLNLAPEHITDTIITVGDPGRVSDVSKHFDEIVFETSHREFVTHVGRIGTKKLMVISTGIGTDNIDIVLNELDALANIDLSTFRVKDTLRSLNIIRLGTCGSLQADVPADEVVLSSHAIGFDCLMHYYNYDYSANEQDLLAQIQANIGSENANIKSYFTSAGTTLLSLFSHKYRSGITATCPGFYAPQGRRLRAQLVFPNWIETLSKFRHNEHKIVNFEMETSGLYGLSKVLGHQCLSISAVVANRINNTFSTNAKATVEKMIKESIDIITASNSLFIP
ncbi:MAG: phosphorylase [Chitinophagia bacterium]|nr:phosphorylase [Chitinophagia bacterium]